MIRYRTDMDRRTGGLIRGWPACSQSIETILQTHLTERVWRLSFGSRLVRHIGRNLAPELVAAIYRDATVAIHRWEPEFRVRRLDVTSIERTGGLGLAIRGLYYPEGRLNNYTIVENADGVFALAASETSGADPRAAA